MQISVIRFQDASIIPDPHTEPILLPSHLIQRDNIEELAIARLVLRMAMNTLLTSEQRKILRMRYWEERSIAEIGVHYGITASAAWKRVQRAQDKLQRHIQFCMTSYPVLLRLHPSQTDLA